MKITRRSLFAKLATIPVVGILFQQQIQAATITDVTAVRIITDLLKDRTVANATPYDSGADLASAALVTKYATAFWTVYDGTNTFSPGTPVPSPTNAQAAEFVIRKLKQYVKEVYAQSQIAVATQTAAATAKATVDAETTTDFGN